MLPESQPNFALATLSQKFGIVESKSTKYDIHSQNENSGTKSKNSTFWLSKSDLHSENEKQMVQNWFQNPEIIYYYLPNQSKNSGFWMFFHA